MFSRGPVKDPSNPTDNAMRVHRSPLDVKLPAAYETRSVIPQLL